MGISEIPPNVQSYFPGASHTGGTTTDTLRGFGLGSSASPAFDALRDFVNVPAERHEGAGSRVGQRHPANRTDDLALTLAPEAQAWIQDAVRSIVDSTLQLHEREGRATFSVLGLGNFGLMVSADRAEIAFVSGEDVLFSAHRSPYPGMSGQPAGSYSERDPFRSSSAASPAHAPIDAHPLRQVIELAAEIGTHPISLLVYLIIAIYALLWTVLSRQARRAPRHARSRARAAPAEQAPRQQPTGRKRRRFRIRRTA